MKLEFYRTIKNFSSCEHRISRSPIRKKNNEQLQMASEDMVLVPQQIKVVADDFGNIFARGHPRAPSSEMSKAWWVSISHYCWISSGAQMDFSASLARE
jgi:hypothetical protein